MPLLCGPITPPHIPPLGTFRRAYGLPLKSATNRVAQNQRTCRLTVWITVQVPLPSLHLTFSLSLLSLLSEMGAPVWVSPLPSPPCHFSSPYFLRSCHPASHFLHLLLDPDAFCMSSDPLTLSISPHRFSHLLLLPEFLKENTYVACLCFYRQLIS